MILAGRVRVKGQPADKPGRMVGEDCAVEIVEDLHPFVGRGGLKLEHALKTFGLSPAGMTAVDVGASTGGFTDCLLQNGAIKVFAIDVGYGQLDWKLRKDPRVVCLDRTNARYLAPDAIGEAVDLAVIDVSFISLKLILPAVIPLLKPGGGIVALVKPQFEVGREEVENKGIIKDPRKQLHVLLELHAFVEEQDWVMCGVTASPITGQKGNREFFIHCVERHLGVPVGEDIIRMQIEGVQTEL